MHTTSSTTSRLMSFALAALITASVLTGLDSVAAQQVASPLLAQAMCVNVQG